MTPEEEKQDEARIKALAKLLNRLPDVRAHDEEKETQASIMAYGLTDMADEADEVRYLFDLLRSPNMTDAKRLETLKELGEAIRHLDYHIHDMAFFDDYVDGEVEQ